MKAKVGDWIRFYQQDKLVIGIVQYITKDRYTSDEMYMTDLGMVDQDSVLEVRSSQ